VSCVQGVDAFGAGGGRADSSVLRDLMRASMLLSKALLNCCGLVHTSVLQASLVKAYWVKVARKTSLSRLEAHFNLISQNCGLLLHAGF